MCDSAQRFLCLSQGKKPDRVPVICNLFDQGAEEMGMSMKEYYSKGEYVAEGQWRLRKKYGYDTLWGFFYLGHLAELAGCRNIIFNDFGPPNVGQMVINDFKDIETFQFPMDLDALPRFQELQKCIRLLKSEAGGEYPILSATVSSFSLPALLIGMEKWVELLFQGPFSLRDELLEKCSQFCRRHADALRRAGANFIVYTSPMASLDMIDIYMFRSHALKWIKRDLNTNRNTDIIFYSGGSRINPIIAEIKDATGIPIYYPNPMDEILETRNILNDQAIFVGVINDIKLLSWSATEIEKQVEHIMHLGAPGGRFIFGTMTMPMILPEEKIRLMLESAYKYGDYSMYP